MAFEIEAKIYLPDLASFQQRLVEQGAQVTAERVHERNQLYLSQHEDFVAKKIILRLRRDTDTKLTFKAPSMDIEGMKARYEFETTVGDYDEMNRILEALGYRHGLFYEKYRTIYAMPGIENAEIMVDEMPFGNFVEVEGTPSAIEEVLGRLGLTTAHHIEANYANIFLALKRAYGMAVDEITFTNFDKVAIDPAIFDTL